MSQADIRADILAMPVADRIELVAKIWDSIADDAAIGLSGDHRKVLEQRLADHQKSPVQGTSWEALKKQLRGN